MFSSWSADRLGCKKAIFIGSLLATIGGALQAGSVAMAMFLVFRFVNGLGVGMSFFSGTLALSLSSMVTDLLLSTTGMLLSLVPQYQSEVSAPHSRGLMVGFHGICVTIGYFSASWIGYGFYFVTALNGAEWRLPLAIQAIPPLFCTMGIMFLPESPRWRKLSSSLLSSYALAANWSFQVISRDRSEEALVIVRKLHRDPNDPDDTYAFREFQQIRQQYEIDRQNAVSWAQIFARPSYRKRMIIGFIVLFGAQTTGTTVIASK